MREHLAKLCNSFTDTIFGKFTQERCENNKLLSHKLFRDCLVAIISLIQDLVHLTRSHMSFLLALYKDV